MPKSVSRGLAWQLAGAAAGGAALLVAGQSVALASYGPPGPNPLDTGGYYCIVTSQSVGKGGSTIGPLKLGDTKVTVTVGSGTFPVGVQITVTEPHSKSGGCSTDPGKDQFGGPMQPAASVGVLVQHNGSPYQGAESKPLVIKVASKSITPRSRVETWQGRRFAPAGQAVVRRGTARITGRASTDVEILSRTHPRPQAGTPSLPAAPAPGRLLTVARLLPPGAPQPGLGVLAR
jgi:hypothetical protein